MAVSITLILIIFIVLVSIQGFNRYDFIDKLKHYPIREFKAKEFHRLLTSGFVHADWMHLFVNMYVLYSFGEYIEAYISSIYGPSGGKIIFIILFLANIILANIPTMIRHKDNPAFASIGASGAVSGIVFIFILLRPWEIIRLFFIIPVPAILVGVAYLVYSSWEAKKERGRIDHSAHFAGAIAGMVMICILDRRIFGEFLHRLVADFPL